MLSRFIENIEWGRIKEFVTLSLPCNKNKNTSPYSLNSASFVCLVVDSVELRLSVRPAESNVDTRKLPAVPRNSGSVSVGGGVGGEWGLRYGGGAVQ